MNFRRTTCPGSLGLVLLPVLLSAVLSLPASAQITVSSASPNNAPQGTVNLNVTIGGKGFKKGAKSQWFVTGTTNPGGVTVNSTAFVSDTQVVANINVAADATISGFDILVTNTDGRTGKGTDLFAVTQNNGSKTSSCPVLTPKLATVASCTLTSPGCLDLTFGTSGLVVTDTGGDSLPPASHDDEGWVPLIQSDGKIVVAGWSPDPNSTTTNYINDFTVVRYNPDGSLDTTFGNGGIARALPASGNNQPHAALLQPDGKIVVAGGVGFFVVRFNSDGTLDATFGSGGIVNVTCPSTKKGSCGHSGCSCGASGLALQSDGKILVSGSLGNSAVVRLNSGGSLDSTFGAGGVVTGGPSDELAIQNVTSGTTTEQLILVGGGFSLMRLTPNGSLDSTFGPNGNGQVTASFCGLQQNEFAMTLDAAGNIVLVGYTHVDDSTTNPKFAMVRFTASGILDMTFGDPISGSSSRTGKTAIDFLGGQNIAEGVEGQTDGKLVVSGWISDPNTSTSFKTYFGLARFNPDGTLDTTFGTGGVVATNFGFAGDFGHAVVIQPDGKIVVAGSAVVPSGASYFGVARYWH